LKLPASPKPQSTAMSRIFSVPVFSRTAARRKRVRSKPIQVVERPRIMVDSPDDSRHASESAGESLSGLQTADDRRRLRGDLSAQLFVGDGEAARQER
jgi:hypothetical protein